MEVSSVWFIFLILDIYPVVRWITPLKSLSASSVLSNNSFPADSGSVVAGCPRSVSVLSLLALPWSQPVNCLQECGSSSGICSSRFAAARATLPLVWGAMYSVWLPSRSALLLHISADFALLGMCLLQMLTRALQPTCAAGLPHSAFTAQRTLELKTPKPTKLYAQGLQRQPEEDAPTLSVVSRGSLL